MARSHPPVTAIMPARDDAAHLREAVDSVLSQHYDGAFELVIGVGPSADDTEAVAVELAETDARVTAVANPGGGTAAGLNVALGEASGEIIVRVDSHCKLPVGYVDQAVSTLRRTGAANVGGVQQARGSSRYQRAVAAAMTSRFGVGDAKFHYGGAEGPADTVYLGVFDAAALREVGGFDESLARNQDYELNWRLRDSGHQIWFDPRLVVSYYPRESARRLARQYFEYGQWKRVVLGRHPRSLKMRQLVAPFTVIGVVAGIVGGLLGRTWMLSAPAIYAVGVSAASVGAASSAPEAATLLGVFPTMHFSWGAGFLVGVRSGREGTPLRTRNRQS